MNCHLRRIACMLLLVSLPALVAAAPRVALLVGNAAYTDAPLTNPPNDVKAVARSLKDLGFEVSAVTNANQKALLKVIREFGEASRQAEVALFYYSGHGLQSRGENFLVPIGAQIQYESDIPEEAVSANSVLRRLEEAAPKAAIVVMDACRDNPVAGRTKSASKGLSRMDAPTGTLVAYATAPGTTAGDEGYYAKSLARYLKEPGLDIKEVFDKVGAEVDRLTRGKQKPRKDDGLYEKVYLVNALVPIQPAPATPNLSGINLDDLKHQQAEREKWDAWQARMAADYHAVEQMQAAPDLKLAAWKRWQTTYGQDNPYSREDERLRAQAEQAHRHAEAEQAAVTQHPAPEAVDTQRAGQTIRDCPECPEMVVIPAGRFEMGSNGGRWEEKPVHTVSVPMFALAKTEVTQGQWQALMGTNPSYFVARHGKKCGDDCPVENVSWNNAQAYVKRLSERTGQRYRLPSEAEWEYACRAGDRHEYCGGDSLDNLAWYSGNSRTSGFLGYERTQPVARKQANAFGLYDMNGNVWEWVEDCWNDSHSGAPTDGSARTSGSCGMRPLRGGSWVNSPIDMRVTTRLRSDTTNRGDNIGFRPARIISP